MADMTTHERIYRGEDALSELATPLVVVCGVGALGSNLLDNLARQGFRNLRGVDYDRVEAHNIGTQLFGRDDVGARKVDAARMRIYRATGVEIQPLNLKVDASTVEKALKGAALVVDCFDNTDSLIGRKTLVDACAARGLPCLHMGMNADFGEVAWQEAYSVPETIRTGLDVCEYPLARNLILLVVALGAEAIIDHILTGRHFNHNLTLRDRRVTTWETKPE